MFIINLPEKQLKIIKKISIIAYNTVNRNSKDSGIAGIKRKMNNITNPKKEPVKFDNSKIDTDVLIKTLDQSIQGFCLFGKDLSVLWLNRKFCSIFDLDINGAVGSKITDIFVHSRTFGSELGRLIDFKQFRMKSTTSALSNQGKRILISHSLHKFNNNDNEPVYLWIADDKTNYVQSREKLENEIKELLITIKSVGDGLITTDLSGKIQHINPEAERITGWQKNFIRYKTLDDVFIVIDELSGMEITDQIKKAIDNSRDQTFSGNYQLISKNGTRTPISFRVNRIENDAKIVKGVAIVFRDETENRRKQKDLIESEARFSAVFNSNLAGITLSSPETGMFIHVNQKFLDVTGYSKEEIFSFSSVQLGIWPDQEARARFTKELLTNGKVENAVLKMKVKSGETRLGQLSAEVVKIGGVNLILSIINDITENIKNEEILKKNKAHLSTAIEIANLAPWEYDIKSDVFTFNDQFYKIFRTDAAKQKGYLMPASRFILNFIFPEDRKSIEEAFNNINDEPIQNLYNEFENRIKYSDGTVGYAAIKFNVEINDSGKANKIYGILQDITTQKQVEQSLQNEKEELNVTLRNIRDGVISTNFKDEIVLINQAVTEITGWSEKEVNGKSIIDFFELLKTDYTSFAGKSKVSTIFGMHEDNLLATSEALEIESKDGSKKIIYYSSAKVTDYDGSLRGFVYVLKDITQQAKIEGQLQLSQKMEAVGQLAAGIAHEINTPMQYIMDNTMFLKDSFNGLKDYISCVNENVAQVTENDNVISKKDEIDLDFLLEEIPAAISQTETGIERVSKIVMAMKDFSHPGQKEKVMADINHGIEVTSIISKNEWKYCADIELKLAKNLPPVFCNVDEINQVILNMIINAAHAIQDKSKQLANDEKGKIIISTGFENSNVIITIADNGLGIPDEIKDKIFNPFFTTKEVGKGTGQGLSIAHNIIAKNHGGQISLESIAGKGTKFFISLPVVVEH